MRSLENTLALWVSGILSSSEVVAWAEREIVRLQQPPPELVDLLLNGPENCLKRSQADFSPQPPRLSYVEAFSIRALSLNLNSGESVEQFARWAASACLGNDLSNPLVRLGYQLDHLINDCDEPGSAKTLVRTDLPALLPICSPVAAPYIETEA